MKLKSYVEGKFYEGKGDGVPLYNAVNGELVAHSTSEGIDFASALKYARNVGGPALRKLTFHQRALALKELAKYLNEHKDELYKISAWTGATKGDSWIDIEGGTGTLFVFSSKARRDLPNDTVYVEGAMEGLSKGGTFVGQHICVPLEGAAVHINAFNFPCWAMLEKLAPSIIAGMPVIIKPATISSFLAARMAEMIVESKLLPEGAFQIVCGSLGDTFEHLNCQDVVTFTGSASTGFKLRTHPNIVRHSIRFNMEADSLNCSILGPDAAPGTPEFDIFIKEVSKEMTVKAGQKCTAVRRTIVPESFVDPVIEALTKRLAGTKVGDPAIEGVRMGPLAGKEQQKEVGSRVRELAAAGEIVFGGTDNFEILGGDIKHGAFFAPTLLLSKDPLKQKTVHECEAFGPVSTVMPYKNISDAITLAKMGEGSLVGSLVTADDNVAREVLLGAASHHGRMLVLNRDCAAESTGHGSPMPHLVHGGPGRAGGGEEMGGIRGVMHFMQRTAIQGSPTTLGRVCHQYLKGGKQTTDTTHPFRKHFEELEIGETLTTKTRTITVADIDAFANLSGDHFYAHKEEELSKHSIFGGRVAHGYFIVSAAAGLFVDPAVGPVLANYGLENLRFIKPVFPGDTIQVKLTVAKKIPKEGQDNGVVAWDVEVLNQNAEAVALYQILTLVKRNEY